MVVIVESVDEGEFSAEFKAATTLTEYTILKKELHKGAVVRSRDRFHKESVSQIPLSFNTQFKMMKKKKEIESFVLIRM